MEITDYFRNAIMVVLMRGRLSDRWMMCENCFIIKSFPEIFFEVQITHLNFSMFVP